MFQFPQLPSFQSPFGGNVQTSMNVRQPYTPQMTQQATNQAVAGMHRQANVPSLLKNVYSPNRGVSAGPAHFARLAQPMADARSAAATARAQIPLADARSNATMRLQGETGREAEGLNLAQLLASQDDLRYGAGAADRDSGLMLLRLLMGA